MSSSADDGSRHNGGPHDGDDAGARPLTIDADALTAAMVLAPKQASRNRRFDLHASEVGAVARRRAARVRGVVRHVTGAFGPARLLELDLEVRPERDRGQRPMEWRLRYRLSQIAVERTTHLTESDLAVVRVAIARTGARVLPGPLLARSGDHARVTALLDRFERVCGGESTG